MTARTSSIGMSETELQEAIREAAELGGWLYYHTHDSRRSPAGFPDVVLVHPTRHELVFLELKRSTGVATGAQIAWIEALRAAGPPDAWVIRPEDLNWLLVRLTRRRS